MALPQVLDAAREYLFADRDRMEGDGLPGPTIRHLERLRDIYNYWVSFPSKRDRDIVAELRSRYGIGDTAAREDLRLIKTLLGDFQRVTKDYMRYRVTQMLERAYEKAEAANSPRDMVAAAKALKEVHQLDKEDDRASVVEKLVPLALAFTDDPAVIGISRMPNFRQAIKDMKQKYWTEATEEVDFEDIDAMHMEDIFKPKQLPYGDGDSAGLS